MELGLFKGLKDDRIFVSRYHEMRQDLKELCEEHTKAKKEIISLLEKIAEINPPPSKDKNKIFRNIAIGVAAIMELGLFKGLKDDGIFVSRYHEMHQDLKELCEEHAKAKKEIISLREKVAEINPPPSKDKNSECNSN